MRPIAFIDTETTHLSADIGEAWEVAVILRQFEDDGTHTDTEYLWQIRPDLTHADPEALRVGRYKERFAVPPGIEAAFTAHESGHVTPMTRAEVIAAITNVLDLAVLVGSNPGFDDRFLRKLLGRGNARWHYRPYDIVQLAAAKIGAQAAGPLPWSSYVLSRAVGVEPPAEDVAHTALGDARWARDVYDAATRPEPIALSWEGRARHAIGMYTRTAVELEDAHRERRASAAAIARARSLASRWGILRAYGGAATELRRALDGPSTSVNAPTQDATPSTEQYHFIDADGDQLYIGIPGDPADGAPAVSFYTPTEPVHVPVERLEEVLAAACSLAAGAQQRPASPPAPSDGWHVGRQWHGHELEDRCPCKQAPCGLVIAAEASPECPEHGPGSTKSTRQSHPASTCPAQG
ncbi:hypothetical protein ACFV3N_16655 [Streptomyces bauhiniae]|uniref:3'-5' exonuclease n=1 Tax=Streptomyces bauhiniae TaxID=2340725 RepID=UPI0036616AAA